MRCAVSGAGLTLSRLEGIASPVGEIFRKNLMKVFFRALRGLPPPLLPTQRKPTA